jgi:hypothetical protein
MKTPDEIVAFIDTLERHMLRRPSMYALTPESLEEQLQLLESLRAFILSGQQNSSGMSAYREYVMRVGRSGAMSFTGKLRNDIWREFCKFFEGYLKSQGRSDKKKSNPKTKHRQGE